MSTNNSVFINFVIPEFETTLTLTTHITTEADPTTLQRGSFFCDVNMNKNIFQDIFLFSTNDIGNWSASILNLEKTMFYVNYSLSMNTASWWQTFANSNDMFNIADSIVQNDLKNISTYTTKSSVNLTEIYCAWYMYRILNGIKDAQVLINNYAIIRNNINDKFITNIFKTQIDNVLWQYNMWSPPDELYRTRYNITESDERYNFVTKPTMYARHRPRDALNNIREDIYGVRFITANNEDQQTVPQRIFEQMAYKDFQRINSISSGNHILPSDTVSSISTSRLSDTILGNINSPVTNIYRFPFIAGDKISFRLNLLVKLNNTLTIFNNPTNSSSGDGNITSTINTLNTNFNNANPTITGEEGNTYLSFIVRITLTE